jgi:hypothetical protein
MRVIYALDLFDEMRLGKAVITTGHANPRSNQPLQPSLFDDIPVLIKPCLWKIAGG